MRSPNEADPADSAEEDGGLEVSPLGARAGRRGGWPRLGRRGRVALAVVVIACAVALPLISLSPTRAAIGGLFAGSPTPIVAVAPTATAIAIVTPASGGSDVPAKEWQALAARPLTLPTLAPGAACPAAQGRSVQAGFGAAIGAGPVYIVGMGTDGVLHAVPPTPGVRDVRSWGYQFALFIIAPPYDGPALARGQRLDDGSPLLFNGGIDQMKAGFTATTPTLLRGLRLEGGAAFGSPWANWMSYLRMREPGCYGIQIDGATFSETIIFSVTFGD